MSETRYRIDESLTMGVSWSITMAGKPTIYLRFPRFTAGRPGSLFTRAECDALETALVETLENVEAAIAGMHHGE